MNLIKISNYRYIAFFGILLFSLNSCDDDGLENIDTISNNDLALSFNKAIEMYTSPKEPGSILIQEINFVGQPDNVDNTFITEKPLLEGSKSTSSNFVLTDEGGSVISNQNKSSKSTNSRISNLFGKKLTIVENENSKSKSSTMTSRTITLPNVISLNTSTNTIAPGTVITWNVDSANNDGVIIVATYNPINQSNNSIAIANPLKITRGIALPDETGSYVVTSSVLSEFPDNAKIDLLIARGVTTSISGKSVTAITQSTSLVDINY